MTTQVNLGHRKVTITLDDSQLQEIRGLVAAGNASSVSGFVKHAVTVALHDAAGWQDMLEDALQQTGGPLTRQERAWAATGTSDIVDAHVVICARRAGQPVVTSDPDDLRRLDPALPLVVV